MRRLNGEKRRIWALFKCCVNFVSASCLNFPAVKKSGETSFTTGIGPVRKRTAVRPEGFPERNNERACILKALTCGRAADDRAGGKKNGRNKTNASSHAVMSAPLPPSAGLRRGHGSVHYADCPN